MFLIRAGHSRLRAGLTQCVDGCRRMFPGFSGSHRTTQHCHSGYHSCHLEMSILLFCHPDRAHFNLSYKESLFLCHFDRAKRRRLHGQGLLLQPCCISAFHSGHAGSTLPGTGVVEPSLEQRPRATLETKVEGSPNAASNSMRYLPAVDMTSWAVDMTNWGGRDGKLRS